MLSYVTSFFLTLASIVWYMTSGALKISLGMDDSPAAFFFFFGSIILMSLMYFVKQSPQYHAYLRFNAPKFQLMAAFIGVAAIGYASCYLLYISEYFGTDLDDCEEINVFNHAACTASWRRFRLEKRPDDHFSLSVFLTLASAYLWIVIFSDAKKQATPPPPTTTTDTTTITTAIKTTTASILSKFDSMRQKFESDISAQSQSVLTEIKDIKTMGMSGVEALLSESVLLRNAWIDVTRTVRTRLDQMRIGYEESVNDLNENIGKAIEMLATHFDGILDQRMGELRGHLIDFSTWNAPKQIPVEKLNQIVKSFEGQQILSTDQTKQGELLAKICAQQEATLRLFAVQEQKIAKVQEAMQANFEQSSKRQQEMADYMSSRLNSVDASIKSVEGEIATCLTRLDTLNSNDNVLAAAIQKGHEVTGANIEKHAVDTRVLLQKSGTRPEQTGANQQILADINSGLQEIAGLKAHLAGFDTRVNDIVSGQDYLATELSEMRLVLQEMRIRQLEWDGMFSDKDEGDTDNANHAPTADDQNAGQEAGQDTTTIDPALLSLDPYPPFSFDSNDPNDLVNPFPFDPEDLDDFFDI